MAFKTFVERIVEVDFLLSARGGAFKEETFNRSATMTRLTSTLFVYRIQLGNGAWRLGILDSSAAWAGDSSASDI
jgi:hypothetical protein